jgi:hypothetical protein
MAKKTPPPSQFRTLIDQASKAVSSMPEGRLKEIAFERILSHLLAQGEAPVEQLPRAQAVRKNTVPSPVSVRRQPDGPSAWLKDMVDEGFFSEPRSSSQIIEELGNRSHHLTATDITLPLQRLCHDKKLRRKKVQLKDGGRPLIHWVRW